MFPGGQLDMQQMLAQAQRLQEQLAQAQEELAHTQVQGTAGGGVVTATVSGAGELLALDIRPEAYDASDPEALATLGDLVVAAVRDATTRAADLQSAAMSPLAQGLGGLAQGGSFEGLGDVAGPGGTGPGGPPGPALPGG